VASWETVRTLALALPDVEEGTAYRRPAFRVSGKVFACESPHVAAALVVYVDPEERPLLLASRPAAYFVTPHYDGHPLLLVRVEAVADDELEERLTDSWLLRAPTRLHGALGSD